MNSTSPPSDVRRIIATLFISQCLGSAALIANATVNAIVGAKLSGRDDLSGLPSTLLLIGAALAAPWAGRFMQRFGRRPGLAWGFFIGSVGMGVSGTAIVLNSFAFFLLGLLLIGGARGAVDQSRYAAADAQISDRRAQAISTVVFAGTIGAIAGPALVDPSSNMLGNLRFEPLAGPMWSGALLFGLAGLLIFGFLRPDPRDMSRAFDIAHTNALSSAETTRTFFQIMRQPAAWLALIAMVIGQSVMVLVMSVTSLHMHNHNHALHDVSLVIMAHTLGMYGFSIMNGTLIDRIGHRRTIGAGTILLIAGSLLAPVSLMTLWLALALFLVGLGWNLCYIAGSSLLADMLAPAERSRVQGANELVINLASALGSLSSGVLLAHAGFTVLGSVSAVLACIPLVILVWQVCMLNRATPDLTPSSIPTTPIDQTQTNN